MKSPKRTIAIEEAFWIPATRELYKPETAEWLDRISGGFLGDVGEKRIQRIDAAGIDVQVLSHVQPGPQGCDREAALRSARQTNDWLGEIMKRTVPEYLHDNVFVTTSGVFEHASLVCALSTIGIDNILFSVDDPFADNIEAVAFLRSPPLSENDREKLAHANAERSLKI